MYTGRFSTIIAALMVTGCAIHPEPEDVTGVDTADIVKQIRCETRDAARKIIIRYLTQLATDGNNRTAQALLEKFEGDQESMADFDPQREFPGRDRAQIRNVFDVIYTAGVAYTFQLTMTEDNNLGAKANFLGPWATTLTLGLMGNVDRKRNNFRQFTVTDKFSFLLRELNTPSRSGKRYCDGHIALGPNHIYPIAGQIGAYNTVRTFFQLSFFDGLAAPKTEPGGSGTPNMADELTFTTVVDFTVSPVVKFAPVKTGFNIVDASLTGLARRTDKHQVTVGLALDPKGKGIAALSSLRGFVFSGAGLGGTRVTVGSPTRGNLVLLNRVTAMATSPAEQLAVLAIDQLKSRELQLITSASP
jgi:hypothetical protein